MLKISHAGGLNQFICLKLEGRVVGPWVEELRRSCEPLFVEERSLTLDLAEVSYADADGVAMLNILKSRGAALARCSPFLEQQMKQTAGYSSAPVRQ